MSLLTPCPKCGCSGTCQRLGPTIPDFNSNVAQQQMEKFVKKLEEAMKGGK